MATVLTCYYRPKPGGLCKRLQRTMQALLDRGHRLINETWEEAIKYCGQAISHFSSAMHLP